MTNELGVRADIYALRERLRWGWKLFSGLLPRAASGEGTGSSTPGIDRASASEVQEWEESSGLPFQGWGRWGIGTVGIPLGRELPDPGRVGGGRTVPTAARATSSSFSHSHTSLCVWIVQGALQPRSVSPPATRSLHRDSLRPGRPNPSQTTPRVWRW